MAYEKLQTQAKLSTMVAMNKSPKNYIKALFVIFLANIIWLSGCLSGENTNSNKPNSTEKVNSNSEKMNSASDNVEELLNVVRLPELPEEAVWLEENNSNPKKITAVLKYTPETATKVVALVLKNKPPEPIEIGLENWFPEELTAQAQLSGIEILKGTAYSANDFFNIPYGSGKITRIEGTDYFVLELIAN